MKYYYQLRFPLTPQGLYDDIGSREDAVQELKVYAQPLLDICEDHVAQDIASSMQKTVAKWNETNDSLKHICGKYKRAVKLWSKYCEDSEAIRNSIDQHIGDVADKTFEEMEVNIFETAWTQFYS